jgi:arsenate reductase
MTTVLYGIKNCDTVRKARAWLQVRGRDYRFHDLRADGLDERRLRQWLAAMGWESLLNRRGTTWRKLPEQARAEMTEAKAVALMLQEPTVIKRPVLEHGGRYLVGFDEARYRALLEQ